MERVDTNPDDFITSFDDAEQRATMTRLDEVICSALPGRSRTLWQGTMWGGTDQSIIGYGDIVQPRPKGDDVEWFLVGLARQKDLYSLYVNAVEDGRYLGQVREDRLRVPGVAKSRLKIGSASIGLKTIDDIDLDALADLLATAHASAPPDQRS
ncbi:MAG: hypothetical protein AAFO29_24110 [Actinomycetota bacterium]